MVNPLNPVPAMLAHRYRVIQVLGEGGFGTTYLAADTQMPSQRQCVVKKLKPMGNHPELYSLVQERFQREAAILELLGDKCEQIPRLYANFSEDQQFYLVEEWIQGETLSQKVSREGALPMSMVQQILLEVLSVLDYVHQNQIVHRDIKPDNILLRTVDKKPVLIDFGAVKETMRTIVQGQAQSSPSIVVGTPGFMPSEQLAGYPVFSSDLFGLGMTAIYLLTGQMPQMMETDPSTGQLKWSPYAPLISPLFKTIIDRCIQLHPKERFQSAEEMRLALLSLPPAQPGNGAFIPTEVIGVFQAIPQVAGPQADQPPVAQPSSSPQPNQPNQPNLYNHPTQPKALSNQAELGKHFPFRWLVAGIIGAAIAGGGGILISQWNVISSSEPKENEPELAKSVDSPTTSEVSPPVPSSVPGNSVPLSSPAPTPGPSSIPDPPVPPSIQGQVSSSNPIPDPPSNQWVVVGTASTGEEVSVNNGSIQRLGEDVQFRYRIGNDLVSANANCPNNRWYVEGFGWYTPQSSATQNMIDHVCSF